MQVLYGGYGHHPSGKQYLYLGNNNYRTGQNIVVPVKQWQTDKIYQTMFTIMRTSASQMGRNERGRLLREGIGLRHVKGRDILGMLPGGKDFKSKVAWKRDSDARYERLLEKQSRDDRQTNLLKATQRLTEG